jgi:hypothetical protein
VTTDLLALLSDEQRALLELEARATPRLVFVKGEAMIQGHADNDNGFTVAEMYGYNLVADAELLVASRSFLVPLLTALAESRQREQALTIANAELRMRLNETGIDVSACVAAVSWCYACNHPRAWHGMLGCAQILGRVKCDCKVTS